MLICTALVADEVPDLTGADEKKLKGHLGRLISLRGRLANSKQGAGLAGATQKGVVFHVIPERPPKGIYRWPDEWIKPMHKEQQVRVIGVLHYQDFSKIEGEKNDGTIQVPASFFYMVLQNTKLEPLEAKQAKPNKSR